MKKILLLTLGLMSTVGFAQKLVAKKDGIYIDKEKTPIVAYELNKKELTFIDKDKKPVFMITNAQHTTKNDDVYRWVTLKNLSTNESNDIPLESKDFFGNIEKQALNYTTEREPIIISKDGINIDNLKLHIASTKRDMRDLMKKKDDSIAQITIRGYEILKERNIRIEKDNTITEDGKDIGIFVIEHAMLRTENTYAYYLYTGTGDNKALYAAWIGGTAFPSKNFTPYTSIGTTYFSLRAFDGTSYNVGDVYSNKQNTQDLTKNPLAREILATLYGYNKNLANGKVEIADFIVLKEKQKQEAIEREKEARKGSEGYITTPTGERINGLITVGDTRNVSLVNPEEIGNLARVTYNDDAGQEQQLTINANEPGYTFTTTLNGAMKTFKGLDVSFGNTLSFASVTSSITLSGKTFYELLYENETGEIYSYLQNKKQFVVKLHNQEKGLYLKDAKNKKKSHKTIRTYLNCQNINLDGLEEGTLDGLKELLKRYEETCK
ncbi:hypothetical protein LNQ81_06185 [Myroides sp. M-43]|uniref:hypothetical protein n=1 Tax=Myroides oncorhynchi TaxID=2893756 RepID=UPI001E53478E|nr:hypothetical protein [Myroides oncorhynchi]MCC9042279.1 hypothetical protein [Myroides oncorhynchi]